MTNSLEVVRRLNNALYRVIRQPGSIIAADDGTLIKIVLPVTQADLLASKLMAAFGPVTKPAVTFTPPGWPDVKPAALAATPVMAPVDVRAVELDLPPDPLPPPPPGSVLIPTELAALTGRAGPYYAPAPKSAPPRRTLRISTARRMLQPTAQEIEESLRVEPAALDEGDFDENDRYVPDDAPDALRAAVQRSPGAEFVLSCLEQWNARRWLSEAQVSALWRWAGFRDT